VGQRPADVELWKWAPLRERLDHLLGERTDSLTACLEAAGPIDEEAGIVHAYGVIENSQGLVGAVLLVDPSRDVINVRYKINRVVQEFHENGVALTTPGSVTAFLRSLDERLFAESRSSGDGRESASEPAPVEEPPPAPTPTPTPSHDSRYRGYFEIGPDLAEFLPCGTFRRTWVENATGVDLDMLRQRLGAGPYEPIYSEVRGRLAAAAPERVAAGYEAEIELLGIERAFPGREGGECEQDLEFEFGAMGHDPDWSAVLDGPRSRLRLAGEPDVPFAPSDAERGPERVRWIVPASRGFPEWQVVVVVGACFDRSSPALLGWNAEVRLADRTLTGCAYRGTR